MGTRRKKYERSLRWERQIRLVTILHGKVLKDISEKTPFENYHDKIDEENILRTLAIFKITNPKSILRFCGGRMKLSDKNQEKALKTCVEGILTGNYLTTTGKSPQEDIKTIKKLGKTLVKI